MGGKHPVKPFEVVLEGQLLLADKPRYFQKIPWKLVDELVGLGNQFDQVALDALGGKSVEFHPGNKGC